MGGVGIAARGANNSNLIRKKDTLTECIYTITLMKGTTRWNHHACEETERILMEDRGKFVAFSSKHSLHGSQEQRCKTSHEVSGDSHPS